MRADRMPDRGSGAAAAEAPRRSYRARPNGPRARRGRSRERLVRCEHPRPLVEPAGEAVAREDPLGRERDAPVGDAVADVGERPDPGERDALARLAAHGARLALEEDRPPARPGPGSRRFATTVAATPSRSSTGSISSRKPAETISGSWAATSSAKPGRTVTVSSSQPSTSSNGAVIVAISTRDHLVQRQLAPDLAPPARGTPRGRRTARSPCGGCRAR